LPKWREDPLDPPVLWPQITDISIWAFFHRQTTTTKHAQTPNMALQAVAPDLVNLPAYLPQTKLAIASERIFNKTAYQWKCAVAGRLILHDQKEDPLAFLVIRLTRGGKSLLGDVCGIMLDGVTLTIVPLLSPLGADQTSKVNSRATHNCLTVVAFHLDELMTAEIEELHTIITDWRPMVRSPYTSSCRPRRCLNPPADASSIFYWHARYYG
jgi:hypothetical protein